MNEIDRRGFDCTTVSNQIVMQQQIEQQNLIAQQQMQLQQQKNSNDLTIQTMKSLQQNTYRPPNRIHCTSREFNGTVTTDCY